MDWADAVRAVKPSVVKIETPNGHGTGFLSFYNQDKTWCGVATANHVVEYADIWQLPIRMRSDQSERFLRETDRVIFRDISTDSAVIFFFKSDFSLPDIPITLMPANEPCEIGSDVGWLGFPNIEPHINCFFSGKVSAEGAGNYLIDGVAIHGVSGGPVFHGSEVSGIRIIGIVSAYHPNVATGSTLPGLLRAQSVSHFHSVANTVRNIDDARRKKEEFDTLQRQVNTVVPSGGPVACILGR